jgi:hypothetical protein
MSYDRHRADLCCEAGARRLADRVTQYWQARGHEVAVEVVRLDCDKQKAKQPVFGLRSNLQRGLPTKQKADMRAGLLSSSRGVAQVPATPK